MSPTASKTTPSPTSRTRRKRRAPNLLAQLVETDQPQHEPSAAQPKKARRRPDLSALFSDEPVKAAAETTTTARPVVQPAEAEPPQPNSEPSAAQPKKARRRPDLSALFAEVDQQPVAAAPQLGQAEVGQDEARLPIPPELEHYLSPDLWRRLNTAEPSRGVLINALERARSVLYLLSTFLPQHLVQEKMRRPVPGLVNGQVLRGSLLFSDVSGFTALSERLAVLGPEGAERLTAIMNRYFARMLEILAWSGGVLLKFAGDATLVFFPEQEASEQANWTVRAGMRMLRAMSEFARLETPTETVTLKMKIGVATGEFLAASVGSADRMEYVVIGPAVARTMAAEGATTGAGQLVVDVDTAAALSPDDFTVAEQKPGFFLVTHCEDRRLDEYEIKAETRRARGAIPWSASHQAILAQIEVALRQIRALTPYLAAELVERIVVHARQRRVESEYRPTTTMFANFFGLEPLLAAWGSDGALAAVGVQRVTSLLNAYFNAMQTAIARYGGIVSRIDPYSKGTKMLVLFGAPVAHEDDPQRAVSAALAMNIELEAINETWRRRFARHLPPDQGNALIQHRIGITFGPTFAGQVGSSTRREYTVMGDDVNLSARLMSAAKFGQILLSQHVYELAADYFVLTALSPIKVKGKSKPVPIYQVEGPRDDTLLNRARQRGPMIGRDAELAQAGLRLQQALFGVGDCLVLQGPPGIGKSHLADLLLNRAAEGGARLLVSQCHSYAADTPYAAWGALLRSLAGISTSDFAPQVQYARLKKLLDDLNLGIETAAPLFSLLGLQVFASREDDRPGPGAAPDQTGEPGSEETFSALVKRGGVKRRGSRLDVLDQLDGQPALEMSQLWHTTGAQLAGRQRQQLAEAWWALLSALAAAAPVVVFFEDAHWMDVASQDLLAELTPRLYRRPVLALLTRRGAAEDHSDRPETALTLGPLSLSGTAALVSHLLVAELAPVIHAQSGGNPLFVAEITRWFKTTRGLSAAELQGVLQTSDVLQKLVLSGVESLPEAQREVVRLASVVGNEFRTGEIQALLPDSIDPVTLSNHLRELARQRLIALAEAGADARYAFQQSLARDILYQSLPFEQRRELHSRLAAYLSQPRSQRRAVQARLASALETTSGRNPAQEAEMVAYHYEQAQAWLPAASHLLLAGDQWQQQAAFAKALALYGRGLAMLEKLPAEAFSAEARRLKAQLYIGQGDTALLMGDTLAAVAAYESGRACLPSGAPDEIEATLSCKLALALPGQNRAAEAEQLLSAILEAPASGAHPAAGAILAWLLWRSGRPAAGQWVEQARAALTPGDPWAAGVSVLLSELAGDWEAAITGYTRLGQPLGAALAAIHQGEAAWRAGDSAAALVSYQQAEALWRGGDQLSGGLALALYRQAEIYWEQAASEAARSALTAAQEALARGAPALQAEGFTAIQQALKIVTRGSSKPWPEWRWQAYDDAFRMALLFRK